MSDFKFTKGKWKLQKDNSITSEGYDKVLVAQICSANNNDEERQANALLISKATEMLEMLQHVSDKLNGNGFPSLQFEIDELIKEATTLYK